MSSNEKCGAGDPDLKLTTATFSAREGEKVTILGMVGRGTSVGIVANLSAEGALLVDSVLREYESLSVELIGPEVDALFKK